MIRFVNTLSFLACATIALGASESFASSCLPDNGDLAERKVNRSNYLAAMDKFDQGSHEDEILFLYISKATNRPTGDSVFVPLPPGGRSVRMPEEVLGGLGPDVTVQVYHRNAGPIFILPYEKGSQEMTKQDCVDAEKNQRRISNRANGLNCEIVNLLTGAEETSPRLLAATIAYGSLAHACDTLVRHPEPPKGSQNEKVLADYNQAISSLNQFNKGTVNRSPAIDAPAVNIGTKKTQDVGTPMQDAPASGKGKTKKTGRGN
jgi:hypothetical protein